MSINKDPVLARQWLNRARKIDKEINRYVSLIRHTHDRLTNVTQTLDSIVVSGTKDPHSFDSLVELEDTINQRIDDLIQVKTEIFKLVQRVPDRNQRLVLIAYYLDMKPWEQIAVDLHYSYDNIMRLRKLGMIEVDRLLHELPKD